MAAITHPARPLPTVTWRSIRSTAPVTPRPVRQRPRPAAVYRRRRLMVATVFLGALLAGSWVLGALGGGSLAASEAKAPSAVELRMEPVSQATHVVAPGDTLWSIARQLAPEGDVRPVVDALAAHRNGRPLQVGERITLP